MSARPTYGVKIGRGTVTHWGDVPLTTEARALACALAIERHTGECGEVVRVFASIPVASPAVSRPAGDTA